jgi:hypothetical protein
LLPPLLSDVVGTPALIYLCCIPTTARASLGVATSKGELWSNYPLPKHILKTKTFSIKKLIEEGKLGK